MFRPAAIIVTLASVALLTGCLPIKPAPTADPTAAALPSASLSAPAALPALVFPDCVDVYTAEQILSLTREGMEFVVPDGVPENTAYGTGFPELRDVIATGESLTCTWVLPASEYGVTVSIMLASPDVVELVSSTVRAAGSDETTTGGESVIFALEIEDSSVSTGGSEAHYLSPKIWVCAQGAESAPALVQAAMERMLELNPAYAG
ncbi:MAG: hypothetical protein ACOH1J_04340 [Microbacteriaceae bacterium]